MNSILKSALLVLPLFSCMQKVNAQAETIPLKPKRISYYCEVDGGYLAGAELRGMFHVKNGLSFGEHFSASLGTGLETYVPSRFVPVFLEARYNVLNRKTSPFVSVSGGYLQGVGQPQVYMYYFPAPGNEQRLANGYTFGGKVGVQHSFTPSLSIVSSVGWRYAYARQEAYISYFPYEPTEMSYKMNRFELAVGLIFK